MAAFAIDALRRAKPAGHVAPVAPAAQQRSLRASAQIAHRHLRRIEPAFTPHFDVRRLEIAVNDVLLVRRFERLSDLLRDGQRFIKGDRAACNALGQVVAFDEFHHERGDAPALFQAVYGGNVRVVQRGEDFGFALKTREPIVVSGQRGRQDLEGDLTLQLRIGGPIHLPHPAFADLRNDFVDAEASVGGKCQVDVSIRAGAESGRGQVLPDGQVASWGRRSGGSSPNIALNQGGLVEPWPRTRLAGSSRRGHEALQFDPASRGLRLHGDSIRRRHTGTEPVVSRR